jgi:general stress protein YciG
MDRSKQREIASKGGKAAHQKGTAHEWTSEEAREAGRKGGIASHQRRRERMTNPVSNEVRSLGTSGRMQGPQDGSAEPGVSSAQGENPSGDQD